MEIIIYGILIYLVLYALYWVFVHVIMPVGKWVGIAVVVAGTIIGAYVALKSYIGSIIENINPYDYYEDKSKNKQEFAARRSYFFGPGFKQLAVTVAGAWKRIAASVGKLWSIREDIADATDTFILKQLLWVLSMLFYLVAVVTVGALGGAITLGLSALHAAVLLVVMAVIYVLFSITWLVDRIYLKRKSIKGNCPNCQTRSVIPTFQCPGCGNMHTKLVPGPYGIWHRQCTCGERLPTTFLMGRSKLKSYCPNCGHELAASDVQQFSLTVVGGTSSGKTVLLSAFYHELFKKIDAAEQMGYTVPPIHEEMFRNLEDWFGGAPCDATRLGATSDMYSVILRANAFETDKQFSLYDIAGEAFDDPSMSSMLPQKQMKDSNGILFVIDPLSSPRMLQEAASEGDDTTNHSERDAATVIMNFVTYLKSVLTNTAMKNRSQKPVAVVISKADLSSISREISYHKIRTVMSANPGMFENFGAARDELCRSFLMDIGLQDAVMAIEAAFTEVHYFPVSAIGHTMDGSAYDPEHVVEPFYWLIRRTEPALAEIMELPDTEA